MTCYGRITIAKVANLLGPGTYSFRLWNPIICSRNAPGPERRSNAFRLTLTPGTAHCQTRFRTAIDDNDDDDNDDDDDDDDDDVPVNPTLHSQR